MSDPKRRWLLVGVLAGSLLGAGTALAETETPLAWVSLAGVSTFAYNASDSDYLRPDPYPYRYSHRALRAYSRWTRRWEKRERKVDRRYWKAQRKYDKRVYRAERKYDRALYGY